MNYYRYAEPDGNEGVIQVKASRRPSSSTMPRRGSWIVQELEKGKWIMPAFTEVGWKVLSELVYLGCEKIEKK